MAALPSSKCRSSRRWLSLLVHMSLERFTAPVPEGYEEVAVMLSRILHNLRTAEANVEDTAEATLRAYEIISRLPNQQEEEDQWDEQDLEEPGDFNEEEFQDLVDRLQADMDQRGEKPGRRRILRVPGAGGLPRRLQAGDGAASHPLASRQRRPGRRGQPMTQEMLEQLLQDSDELELDAEQGDITDAMTTFARTS